MDLLGPFANRRFYTDGNLDFPPDRGTLNSANAGDQNGGDSPPNQPYWSYNENADEVLVNGSVWPNLNVNRQEYRFRMLAGSNAQLYDLQLCLGDWNAAQNADGTNSLVTVAADGNSAQCNSTLVPFTVIGSDGGYLPAPLPSNDIQIGITERAAHRIVNELVDAGYVSRRRSGRRNHYTVHRDLPLPDRLARTVAATCRLVCLLTRGRLTDAHDEVLYVIRKPEERFARVV